jgi:hypothetical protein
MTTDNLLTADVPEKFKDPQTGQLRTEALLQSYLELERKMSTVPSAPAKPEDYQIDVSHGLFDIDPDVNARLHQCGCTPQQAQEVYNLAAEKLLPMIMQISAEFKADREVEKLINHFGGAEQWKEVSRQLLAFGRQNLPPELLESMSSSFEGVLALHRMMQSEEPGLKPKSQDRNAPSSDALDLQSMMRDPKYWRDKDPSFVAKVTEGFQKVYGAR